MNLYFFVTGHIDIKFGTKCQSVSIDLAPNRHFGLFWWISVWQAYESGVTFFDLPKPSICYRKGQQCAHSESIFCGTYRFGCTEEATRTPKSYPNFDKGTLTIALRWQSYRIRHVFSFELLYIPSYRRSNGVPFLRKFFVRLTVLPQQGSEVTHPIFSKTSG